MPFLARHGPLDETVALRRLSNLSRRRASHCVVGIILVSSVVKAIYAWRYYGFYTGDDVEIHEMVFATIFRLGLESLGYPLCLLPVGLYLSRGRHR